MKLFNLLSGGRRQTVPGGRPTSSLSSDSDIGSSWWSSALTRMSVKGAIRLLLPSSHDPTTTSHDSRPAASDVFLFQVKWDIVQLLCFFLSTSENGELSVNFFGSFSVRTRTTGRADETKTEGSGGSRRPSVSSSYSGEGTKYTRFTFFHLGPNKIIHLCIKLPLIFLGGGCLWALGTGRATVKLLRYQSE